MTPKKSVVRWRTALVAAGVAAVALLSASSRTVSAQTSNGATTALSYADQLIQEGRKTFRYDTFGDEAFWGGTLRLHEAIAGAANGGVGPGVSPKTALAVGLKVDVDALPRGADARSSSAAQVDLDDPATTLALLKLNAVVGVTGSSTRTATHRVDRHPVRALPFDGRRLVRARHRPPARRLGRIAT